MKSSFLDLDERVFLLGFPPKGVYDFTTDEEDVMIGTVGLDSATRTGVQLSETSTKVRPEWNLHTCIRRCFNENTKFRIFP